MWAAAVPNYKRQDGPPGNDDEPAIELKRKGARTVQVTSFYTAAEHEALQQQQLYQQRRIASAAAALRQRQDHQHAFGHAYHHPSHLHHHAQPAYQLPPHSYHAVGAYQFHAVGLLPPPYHAQPLHHAPVVDRGSHAQHAYVLEAIEKEKKVQKSMQLEKLWREDEEEYLRQLAEIRAEKEAMSQWKARQRGEWEPEMARRNAREAFEAEEEMARQNGRIYAEREEEASRREAAEKEERQREAAEKEEEMARRRSGRDARINAFREYRDNEANALTSSTSRAEIKDPELDAKQPEETPKKNAELDVSYLLSEKAKFEEMRSRLGAAMESLGDPEATKEAKQALRGKRDKIISGIPRGEKRATRSLAETERFVAFCLKCSGYYDCNCCCKARAAEVMDQAKEKLNQEDEEDFFGLKSNLFSTDH